MKIKIGNRFIGDEEPCFIIAEAGSNHNRDFKTAKGLIDAAFEAGADAIKFQVFSVKNIIQKKHRSIQDTKSICMTSSRSWRFRGNG